jgi:phage terminase Nu1 subunit (DNA packaging protein)
VRTFEVSRQADVAEFFGRSIDTVKNWAKQGMPGKRGCYDVSEIAKWLGSPAGPWRAIDDDSMDGGPDSPGLERYRLAKAALAELDLEERRGVLLSRDKARSALTLWGSIIRRMGDMLGKKFGTDAALAISDALAECRRLVDTHFGDPDDESTTGSEPNGH